jgi:hypothetical protein
MSSGVTGTGSAVVTCVRRGRQWRLEAGRRSVLVERSRGMTYLAILIANPGHEVPAAELAAGPGSTAPAATAPSPQPVLDAQALRQYRHRLTVLRRELDRCDATGDREGAARADAEREWLLAQLRSTSGLTGRPRSFATADERARVAVGKAIRRALRRIAAADPDIGEILSSAIQTGQRCAYHPLSPRDIDDLLAGGTQAR